ncbi:MAG: glycosyltransferase [Chitinophagales bacterium]
MIQILNPSKINSTDWPWQIPGNVWDEDQKKDWPKISIITPSFNQGQFLEETLRSIIFQNYPNLQLIVIDGGSTDESVNIIKHYETHIDYWVSEPDLGQTDAINKGVALANGDYFYWVNSDDYLEPNALHQIAQEILSKNADVLLVKIRALFEENGKTSKPYSATICETKEHSLINAQMSNTLFYNLHKAKTLFPLETNLLYAMDFALYYKFILKYGIDGIKNSEGAVVNNYRFHETSKTNTNLALGKMETRAMHKYIIDQLDPPDFFSKYFEKAKYNESLKFDWEIGNIDKSIFLGVYAKNIANFFYEHKLYQLAKVALNYAKKNSQKIDYKLWFKLNIISPYLMNKLRLIKSKI